MRTDVYYAGVGPVSDLKVNDPAGTLPVRVTHYEYGGCGSSAGWSRCYDKPTKIVDPNGHETNFEYSPDHGGILTETKPADPNGVRPVTRYAYSQHYAWLSNGAGGYVQAVAPVWLLDAVKACRATATVNGACQGGSTDEVVTGYDYGPNA